MICWIWFWSRPELINIEFMIPLRVLLLHLVTPFDLGKYGAVVWCIMLDSKQYSSSGATY